MMDFDELQKSWKTQQVDIPEIKPEAVDELMGKWTQQQKKLKRRNILSSVAFFLVFINLGWVYTTLREGRSIFFGGSILMMALLMVIYIWVMWKGVTYDKYDPAAASNVYIDKYLQKLYWQRKTVTRYTWVYAWLIWLAFMFYCYDITTGGAMLWRILIPVIITIYIFGMLLITRYTAKKKQLKKIDELIEEMEEIKGKMEGM